MTPMPCIFLQAATQRRQRIHLVVVTNEESRAFVFRVFDVFAGETGFVRYAEIAAELLELTALAADTGKTFFFMRGEDELEIRFSRLAYFGRIGENLHSLGDAGDAGGHESARALDLDKASRQAPISLTPLR